MKNPPANVGDVRDVGSIPGSGRSPGEGNGNPLQYSCLESPTDRGAWWAPVHWVTVDMTEASLHAGTGLILGKMGTMAEGMGQNSHEWHIQGDTPSISPLEGSVIS